MAPWHEKNYPGGKTPNGIEIVRIGVNIQQGQDAQTDNFIQRAKFDLAVNDFGGHWGKFQNVNRSVFVIINGATNLAGHQQWEVLVNDEGFGTRDFTAALASWKKILDPLQLQPAAVVPKITTHPANINAPEGSTVTLSVQTSGTEPLAFQWFKDAQAVPGATNSTLVLADISSKDAGDYSVSVSNSAGSVTSNSAKLTVEIQSQPPSLTNPILSSLEGFSFTLNGAIGRSYRVEVSTDLKIWITLQTIVLPTASQRVTDLESKDSDARFYRVVGE